MPRTGAVKDIVIGNIIGIGIKIAISSGEDAFATEDAVLSGILSGIISGGWGPAVPIGLGWSPAVPTELERSPVEVQQCPLRSGAGEEARKRRRRRKAQRALLKSNNPHLAGGEQWTKYFYIFLHPPMSRTLMKSERCLTNWIYIYIFTIHYISSSKSTYPSIQKMRVCLTSQKGKLPFC